MKATETTLAAVASVEAGFSVKGIIADEPDGTHQVIMTKHLTAGEPYRYSEEHRLRISPDRGVDKYQVKSGDIVLVSRGTWNYPVLIEEVPPLAIAPSTLYIIRPSDAVDPYYLTWVMQQEAFQNKLGEIRVGSGTKLISRADLEQMTIPVPSVEDQKKIASLAKLMCREWQIRRKLLDETERFQAATGKQLFNMLAGGEAK